MTKWLFMFLWGEWFYVYLNQHGEIQIASNAIAMFCLQSHGAAKSETKMSIYELLKDLFYWPACVYWFFNTQWIDLTDCLNRGALFGMAMMLCLVEAHPLQQVQKHIRTEHVCFGILWSFCDLQSLQGAAVPRIWSSTLGEVRDLLTAQSLGQAGHKNCRAVNFDTWPNMAPNESEFTTQQ